MLGGEVGPIFRNSDAPDAESRMPGGDNLVMNMSITLGRSTVMGSDAPEEMYSVPQGFRVSIAPSSLEEFDRVHAALSRDAQSIQMPPGETFWAERFAMFTDRYGTPWMLNYDGNKSVA
ncbi:VOC family protein [Roseibium salinum]|nr:VOC family protein [Roseibium salinum]